MQVKRGEKTMKKTFGYITEKRFEEDVIFLIEEKCINPLKIKCILSLFYYTGIKLNEFAMLTRKDINLDRKTVRISSRKGERVVSFDDKLASRLKAYFKTHPKKGKNVFNLTVHGVKKICQRLNRHYKNINLSPRYLRHSYIISLLEKHVNEFKICELTGLSIWTFNASYIGAPRSLVLICKAGYEKKRKKGGEKRK